MKKLTGIILLLTVIGAAHVFAVNVTVDYNSKKGTLHRCEHTIAGITNLRGPLDRQLMRDLGVKYVRTFRKLGSHYGHETPADIISYGAEPVICISTLSSGYPDLGWYENAFKNDLRGIKSQYPSVQYIEVDNEPECCGKNFSPTDYNIMYSRASAAAKAVNAELAPGVPKIKLGGPTISGFKEWWLTAFLDHAKANNLQMDFVSWHDYGSYKNPAGIAGMVRKVDGLLAARGLKAETFVTEWGYNPAPGDRIYPTLLTTFATYTLAANYYYIEGGLDKPFVFAMMDYHNVARSMLAPKEITSTDGKVFPLYNMYKMLSMLRTERLGVISDGLTAKGTGVNAIAAGDNGQVTVMIWNYFEWLDPNQDVTRTVSVKVNNLPSSFTSKNYRIEQYLIDDTHSNYAHNAAKDKLEKVKDQTAAASGQFSTSVTLMKNAVTMFVLTPDGGGTPPPPPPEQVAAPSISPNGGTFTESVSVSLSCATTGASIRYTTDGSTPTTSSTAYSSAITITSTSTIKAKAFKSGMDASTVASATFTKKSGTATGANLALNQPVTVSSEEKSWVGASLAVDGDTATRWSSAYADGEWIQVDLGSSHELSSVVLKWEAAYASGYTVQVSDNASSWTTAHTEANGQGGTETVNIAGRRGRYVRVTGTQRGTIYGISLWELELYGPEQQTGMAVTGRGDQAGMVPAGWLNGRQVYTLHGKKVSVRQIQQTGIYLTRTQEGMLVRKMILIK